MATHVFTDIETGGTEMHHPIIQIAAVAMVNGEIRGEFERKIQFDPSVCDEFALVLTGYSPERWAVAKPALEVAKEFASFLNSYKTIQMVSKKTQKPYKVARIAGYNCAYFDMPRLLKFFKDLDVFLPAHPQSLDVMQLLFWYLEMNPSQEPENRKLETVCKHFGIEIEEAHDALADIRATAELAHVVTNHMIDFLIKNFAPVAPPTSWEPCGLCGRIEEIPF